VLTATMLFQRGDALTNDAARRIDGRFAIVSRIAERARIWKQSRYAALGRSRPCDIQPLRGVQVNIQRSAFKATYVAMPMISGDTSASFKISANARALRDPCKAGRSMLTTTNQTLLRFADQIKACWCFTGTGLGQRIRPACLNRGGNRRRRTTIPLKLRSCPR
jgi:hypothetical protein